MGLRAKILLPLLLFSALFLTYLYGQWIPRLQTGLESEYRQSVERHLDSVAQGMIPLLLGHQLDTIYENMDSMMKNNSDWISIQLIDAQGKTIYPLQASAPEQKPLSQADILVVPYQISYLDMNLGKIILEIDMAPRLSAMNSWYRNLAAALAAMLCCYFISISVIIERVVRKPVNLLAHASEKLAEGVFDTSLPPVGHDEVGTLTTSFTRMRDSIRDYQKKLVERNREIATLSQAVEQSPVSVMITDTVGNILFVNPNFTQVTGYEPDEVKHRNSRLLQSGKTSHTEYAQMWATILSGNVWRGELYNRKKNGEFFWESASISPIQDENGTINSYLAVKEDITERKRAEEALHLQTIELEEEVAERQMAQENLQEKAILLEEEIEKRQKAQDELEQLNKCLEQRIAERTAELEDKNTELYKMNRLFVGRELRMVELKERVRGLEKAAN